MWSDARIPAFGQLRPPPQRRVLRTMCLMVCEHESIVRQHSEIVFGRHLPYGDVILKAIFMISWISPNDDLKIAICIIFDADFDYEHHRFPFQSFLDDLWKSSFFVHDGKGGDTSISLWDRTSQWQPACKSNVTNLVRLSDVFPMPHPLLYHA